ncbi:IS3 family transposase [Amycolatopsis sp. cmx-11-12]|uniref:IS3 family transposase n=1 Tax=Amycolatopsis sp. cmx-11-12 TaxID=2785795 RepID=UPI003917C6DF
MSKSGFYEWRTRPESETARRRQYLAGLITKIFTDSDETYGHRRIHAQLERQGERCTPELVRQIMRGQGLEPCQPKPWRPALTDGGPAILPDLLRRNFSADAPCEKMVGSGSPGESHPRAPTEPGVTVSRHRALVALITRTRESNANVRTSADNAL